MFGEPFSGTIEETFYTKNLKYAKSFFVKRLTEVYEDDGINGIATIYKKLTQKLMFNIHEIEDDYDVFVAFETMNNRGKPLTNLELLKNRLIYLTTLFSDGALDQKDKEALRKQINDTWKEVYYQLGRNRSISLSDDDFLRAHWIIFYQYTRQKGTDYIKFLLGRFSSKNIYEKQIINQVDAGEEIAVEDSSDEDDELEDGNALGSIITSKLQPKEIDAYVRSLKETAKYWYYTYFPQESELTDEEIKWLDRLNRIGIGYFRPLITASLTPSANTLVNDRIALFKAIERFVFICFRMGMFQASYQSSVYYRRAKEIYFGEANTLKIANDLNALTTNDTKSALVNLITRMDKRFSDGDGFYSWRDLRYLLFEYEYALSDQNKIQKVDWSIFSKLEKDKITIEHILPQKPTKWYWSNQFRSFNDDEIKILSNSLGNLLPLAQSINYSLQNDSFEDKKNASVSGRRGYQNGSHSEIEVSKEPDWNADNILNRGKKILSFMEKRWVFNFKDDKQRLELLHLQFLQMPREEKPEIEKSIVSSANGISKDVNFQKGISTFKSCELSVTKSDSTKNSILSKEMVAIAYQVAKKVYAGILGRTEGKDEIVKICGMKPGSAGDYITGFLSMMDGTKYTRTLNEYSTCYFLEHIEKDYGIDALKQAIKACEQHAKYYATLGHGRLVYVERLVQKYSSRSDIKYKTNSVSEATQLVDELISVAATNISDFYLKLEKLCWLKTDYVKYMTTEPIEVDTEIKRLPNADFDLCCALLTMLLREDHISNGAFYARLSDGSVKAVLMRMSSLIL